MAGKRQFIAVAIAGLAFHETWCFNADAPTTQGRPQVGADRRKNRRVAVSANPPQFAANFPLAKDGRPYQDNESVLVTLNMQKSFDSLTLNSTSAYYYYTHKGSNCSDGVYMPALLHRRREFEQFA